MNCTLIADTRERSVLIHKAEFLSIKMDVKQITTADYVILSPAGEILVVIERKSLDDYGASLKDGRANNKSKLFALRETTGCSVVYLIEGPAFPSANAVFGGIPYSNIRSSIFHLIRNNVTVLFTKNTLHTAQTLVAFVKSMTTLEERKIRGVKLGAGSSVIPPLDNGDPEEIRPTDDIPAVITDPIDVSQDTIKLLTEKHSKSNLDIVRLMWAKFPGISVETADLFIHKYSLKSIVCGEITRADITNMKTATGRNISKKVINSLTTMSKPLEAKLLQTIPGVSASTAAELTNERTLSQILQLPIDELKDIPIGLRARPLGSARAISIHKYFDYTE